MFLEIQILYRNHIPTIPTAKKCRSIEFPGQPIVFSEIKAEKAAQNDQQKADKRESAFYTKTQVGNRHELLTYEG